MRSPEGIDRLRDPPDVDAADAASIVDWLENQRSLSPLFTIVSAAVGALLADGLLIGLVRRPNPPADRERSSS
ncbi:hypothetical protein [Streptomyces sp. NPDC050560]|uniref:hypothetical protein n=1 Tax=Streptomyces sp. NPDC050560 TaxID=3365630 RepID=UPI003798FB0A